jgi:hypothetical protein
VITLEWPIFPATWLTGNDHESQRYTKVAHKANSILLYQVRCITLVSGLERKELRPSPSVLFSRAIRPIYQRLLVQCSWPQIPDQPGLTGPIDIPAADVLLSLFITPVSAPAPLNLGMVCVHSASILVHWVAHARPMRCVRDSPLPTPFDLSASLLCRRTIYSIAFLLYSYTAMCP